MSFQKWMEPIRRRCAKAYRKKEDWLRDPYQLWIKQNETKERLGQRETGARRMTGGEFATALSGQTKLPPCEWLLVCVIEGDVRLPSRQYAALFKEQSDCGMIYGDEDMADKETGRRYGAWFKPEYSPETLLSFFCFGSSFFLRRSYVEQAITEYGKKKDVWWKERERMYDFILFYTEWLEAVGKKICHVPEVLFSARGGKFAPENIKQPEVVNKEAYWGYEREYNACKEAAFLRRGIHAKLLETKHGETSYFIPVYLLGKEEPKVSIVIPSKDHVEVLAVCLRSIKEKTAYTNYEIIVVDNGSSKENRKKTELLQEEICFSYLYEPMDFNFSAMCNLGVKKAEGSYILLLNDDMEVIGQEWLERLLTQAMQEHVAAVGAKLIYPGTDIIQHVGMTSLPGVGPAHQLVKEHDKAADYYYGKNVLVYDMIGVTAACLMVSKKIYEEAGGFYEGIEVSYNDADFCFTLHEMGYRNVIRNDVVLYHHESLSRGDDRMSDAKWERLLKEKEKVYRRHPALEKKDPYYNENLAGYKHKYFCNYLYPYEERERFCTVRPYRGRIKDVWHNDCIMLTLEHAKLERKLSMQEMDAYWLEGWAYVLDMDQSRYKRTLLLVSETGQMYEAGMFDRYRQDVVDILPEQTNVGLSGFFCRIRRGELAPGTYKVALLYKDMLSRQRLYKECDKLLEVTM